jgi:alpha-tubulin suppressor-like RCC1 family protein
MSSPGSLVLLLSAAVFSITASCKLKSQPAPAQQEQVARPKHGVPFDDVVKVATGDNETCVITSSELMYCAGGDPFGSHPEMAMARWVKNASNTTQISLGANNSCAVQRSGKLVCWGSNSNHILPDETPSDAYAEVPGLKSASQVLVPRGPHPVWVLQQASPIPLILGGPMLAPGFVAPREADGIRIAGDEVVQAEVGWDLCVRTIAGEVRCWEGTPFHKPPYEWKKPVPFLPSKVVDIAAAWIRRENANALCALGDDGKAVCWRYQNGPNSAPSQTPPHYGPDPYPIDHPLEQANDWRDIAMAYDHSCGVKRDGSVWCAGRNHKGQLGNLEPHSDTLRQVPGVTNAKAVEVGWDHSCALIANGSVTCWGGNSRGQCGTASPRSAPVGPTQFLKYIGPEQ